MRTKCCKLALLAALLISGAASAQEFPIGIWANWVDLDSLVRANFTWVLFPNERPKKEYTNSQKLKIIAYRARIYNPSVAQRLHFEAEQDGSNPMKDYFQVHKGGRVMDADAFDGESRVFERGVHAPGIMLRSPVPDNEYHYGRTAYVATFRIRIQKNQSGDPDVVRLWIKKGDLILKTRLLKYREFVDTKYDTFQVPFDLNRPVQSPLSLNAQTTEYQTSHHVDIQVEWFGKVTTWVDRVVVEDIQAQQLFAGNFDAQIISEAGSYSYPLIQGFYLNDEPFLNGFLPFLRVDSLLKTVSENRRGVTPVFHSFQRFIQDTQSKELMVDNYPIKSNIPSPSISDVTADSIGVARYSNGGQHSAYTRGLQSRFDNMIDEGLRPAITAAKNAVPARSFWFIPQLHGLLYKKTGGYRVAADTAAYRNPTPAEIHAMGYLALAYGAKGIMYYPYYTALEDAASPNRAKYNTGLVQQEGNNNQARQYFHASNWATFLLNNGSKKKVFTGNSEKWNGVKALNARLKTLGPILVSLTWQNAASIHKNQIGNLSQIIKYLYALKANNQQDRYPSSTYAEAGHMKDGQGWDYLMVVNRRCAPTQGSIDDRRKMKIQLNKGTGTWAVSQIPSGEYWTLPGNGWLTTSLFEPGDGRLYRIAPSVIYVPQNFATIHEALEATMAGQTVQVAAGIYYEKDNLTVKDGVTLQLSPGVILKFANGK